MNTLRAWLLGVLAIFIDCELEREQTERIGRLRARMMETRRNANS